MGLYAKMASVMGEVGYIRKRGRNTVQNYDYVMAADIAGEMAKLLAKYGIAFAPVEQTLEWETRESARGNALFVCKAKINYKIFDIETGESIVIPSFGEGMDNGDKAAYKAMTGALKYAMIQTFLIAAGDDPEDETEEKEIKAAAGATKVASTPACPLCGAVNSIIKGLPQYGGGWVCFGKKGGCGAKFKDDDRRITAGGNLSDRADDGPDRSNRETITEEQVHQLEEWCHEFQVNPTTVIKQYQMSDPDVKTFADLTEGQFRHAQGVFEKKRNLQLKLN